MAPKAEPQPDWISLKNALERERFQIGTLGGDTEAALDLQWALQHPGETCSAVEVRERRKAREAEIVKNAAEMEKRLKEEREAARIKAAEEYALSVIGDHVLIHVAGERVKKLKKFEDLCCPKCRKPSYDARNMVMTAAEHYQSANPANPPVGGGLLPLLLIESCKCPCGEGFPVMVQVVY